MKKEGEREHVPKVAAGMVKTLGFYLIGSFLPAGSPWERLPDPHWVYDAVLGGALLEAGHYIPGVPGIDHIFSGSVQRNPKARAVCGICQYG